MTTDRGYPWLKFYTTLIEDPKWLRLSDCAKSLYIECYLLAGKADAGGLLVIGDDVANTDTMAFITRREVEHVQAQIDELIKANLMSKKDDGISITRFQDEQGPSQADKRELWRLRQIKKRGKFDQNQNQDQNKEKEKEKEKEVEEEEEEEVTRESRVTLKKPPPPRSSSSFNDDDDIKKEVIQTHWRAKIGTMLSKKKTAEFLRVVNEEPTIIDYGFRLIECLSVWCRIVDIHKLEGWTKNNPDAIMELYPIPNLEDRMQRENVGWNDPIKEKERLALLTEHGLI